MNKSVKDELDEILKLAPKDNKAIREDCQYLLNSEERFCRATTHTTCAKCRFYDPKYEVKIEKVVELVRSERQLAEQERKRLLKAHEKREEELIRRINFYRTCGT